MSYFEMVSPVSQGIDPKGITNFVKALDKKGLELHRLMIVRHGKCVAKGAWAPYKETDMHPLYSFSKSLTATAIGFAVQEGILTLNDRIVDIFPELVPELGEISREGVPDDVTDQMLYDHLQKVTLHHLLIMGCGHEFEITDKSSTWKTTFMKQPVIFEPGTFYKYNTAGTNMLAAVLKRKTGQDVTEFLRPRLFDPIGIAQATCETLPDAENTQMGGSGFRLTLEGMARFTYFMLQKGYWDGKAILPGWYELAGSKLIETAGDSEGHIKEWANGYGYQCWMCSLPGSFRADGAFGQFGFVFPTLDLIIMTNAATEQTQSLVDAMYDHLIPAVYEDEAAARAAGASDKVVDHFMSKLHIPALKSCHNPTIEAWLSDKIFHLAPEKEAADIYEGTPVQDMTTDRPQTTGTPQVQTEMLGRSFPQMGLNPDRTYCSMAGKHGLSGLETLIGGAGLRRVPDDTNITEMSFTFADDQMTWQVLENGQRREVTASLTHDFLRTEMMLKGKLVTVAASAGWRSRNALEMEIRRMDTSSGVRMLFRFQKDTVSIDADETLMTDGGLGMWTKRTADFVL